MPNLWTFLNSLNLLEVLRSYLKDRHERSKDHIYREYAEAKKLRLENAAIELQNIQHKIEIIRSLGASQQDLNVIKELLQYQTLLELLGYQYQRTFILAKKDSLKVQN